MVYCYVIVSNASDAVSIYGATPVFPRDEVRQIALLDSSQSDSKQRKVYKTLPLDHNRCLLLLKLLVREPLVHVGALVSMVSSC